jgi:hypothetical protein
VRSLETAQCIVPFFRGSFHPGKFESDL